MLNLKKGQSAIVAIKAVKGSKYQIELAEFVNSPYRASMGIAGLLNKSDDKFSSVGGGPRRAWQCGEAADIAEYFDVDIAKLEALNEGDVLECSILNPEINGTQLHIQVTEMTEAEVEVALEEAKAEGWSGTVGNLEYLLANKETRAKRRGAEGDFITTDGELVFSITSIVAGVADNNFHKPDVAAVETADAEVSAETEMTTE